MSPLQSRILAALDDGPRAILEITRATKGTIDKGSRNSVRVTLHRMVQAGTVARESWGVYRKV